MGIKNEATKKYVRRPDIFADIANYYLFGGEQRIHPEELQEKDITELVMAYNDISKVVSKEKLRDVIKSCTMKTANGYDILIIGVENQSDIHYAMPVKNLVYDAINYTSQADAISQRHKKAKDLTGDEFLSHFSKEDKLIPIVTITVYYGIKKWDAPRSLHEMFACQDLGILKYVDNYHLNLIIPEEIQDFGSFHTQFGQVMEFISASASKEKMQKILENQKYQCMERDAVSVLEACTNINIPKEYEKEGKINMCKAWTDQFNDGREIGIKKGIEEGEIRRSLEIYEYLIQNGTDPEEAQKITKLTDEELEGAYAKKVI